MLHVYLFKKIFILLVLFSGDDVSLLRGYWCYLYV